MADPVKVDLAFSFALDTVLDARHSTFADAGKVRSGSSSSSFLAVPHRGSQRGEIRLYDLH
jgi:hypothetical protein